MKKTTIDTKLLPKMWLTWETTKGTFYLDCTTGKKQIEKPESVSYRGNDVLIKSGSKPRWGYAKYHEKMEMLELAEVTIDTTRKEEPKKWRYVGEKYFLKKDKTVLDENGNVKTEGFNLSQYHYSRDFKGFLGLFYRIAYYKSIEEFKKLLGSDTYTISSGRTVTVCSPWHIQEWYKTSQKVRGAGKQQKLTNKLVEMQVKDIEEVRTKYPIPPADGYSWRNSGIIVFERLEDGWSVLRVFEKYSDKFEEKERMYLHDDGTNRIVAPNKDGWIPARQMHSWGNYTLANKSEAMEQCKRLKYIIPHIEKEEQRNIRNYLITILRFPEVEQMISLGYKEAAKYIMGADTPKANMKYLFGGYYNEKETSLLRKVGLTKHQLDKHMQHFEDRNWYVRKSAETLLEMRDYFGNDLLHLDNTSFDEYYDAFLSINRGYGRRPFYQLERMDVDRVKFIKNAFRLGKKNSNVYTLLDDTLSRYHSLNYGTQPEINWFFDSYSDVVRAHDAIDELKRIQDAERRAMWDKREAERLKLQEKKRIEIDEKRKEYEYEDENYVVRLPKSSNEIIDEGSLQRICIGGYTTRHALGNTNLFFLRRKSQPDTPFYAIEMDNTKRIVQIHGYCNKWLGNNPDAIPTVVRWLRKNGIKCDEKILTCKSTGYSSINEYVKMPVVD